MAEKLHDILQANHQEKLIAALEKAAPADRTKIEKQLTAIHWGELAALIQDYVFKKPETVIPSDLTPAPFFPFPAKTDEQKTLYADAFRNGEMLLSKGKVAVLTVAGGQGTRLGFDGPKGTYPITPVLHKTLFQYFAESLTRAAEKFGAPIHWYIMTSEINDAATRKFFADHNYFGLGCAHVSFFTQGMMPAVSYAGDLLLGAKDSLALAPNGHGGTLLALRKSGALDRMKAAGVEYISYFQVDNPLVPVVDPLFLGLHHLEGAEISARMLPKTDPYEKLGNFCLSGGRLQIIEYSDMPADLAERRKADGTLDFLAGSPAIHVISREFVERLTADGRLNMPWHRADKKVAYLDDCGNLVKPEKPNAVKLESFIFDALPLAKKTMVLEGCRAEIFAPTKNVSGVDSAESCRAMLVARDARRLELSGVAVPRKADGSPDCVVEISPRCVFDDADAAAWFKAHPQPALRSGSTEAFGK